MFLTVNDIYKYNREHSFKMLSAFTSANEEFDFWQEYKDNYNYFDRMFMKSYRSFIAFNAEGDQTDEVADDFRSDVYSWLMANDKRYSELYRLQLVDDDKYNFMFNYDMKEVYSGTNSSSGSETLGQRQDSHSGSNVYGAKSETISGSATIGAHTDGHETTYGAVSNSDETKVSAFNESGYSNKEKTDHTEAQRIDNLQDSYGTHTDTSSETRAALAHTDTTSGTDTKGSQTNSNTSSGTEGHTLTRQGNIGVETTSDIMKKHVDLWKAFNFYKIVFDDIANEFLRV